MEIKRQVSLSAKINIKNAIDLVCMFMILITILFLLISREIFDTSIIVIVFSLFFIFIIQYECFRHWIMRSLKTSVKEDLKRSDESSQKILAQSIEQKAAFDILASVVRNIKSELENMKNSIFLSKQNLQNGVESVTNVINMNDEHFKLVSDDISQIKGYKQKILSLSELILELNESVGQIFQYLGLVEDITEQTNMLALNAAVEAARAGEHGKGFAVVAGEIRKLADDSKQATARIMAFVSNVQQTTNSAILATEESIKDVEKNLLSSTLLEGKIKQIAGFLMKVSANLEDLVVSIENEEAFSSSIQDQILSIDEELKEVLKNIEINEQHIKVLGVVSENFKQSIIDL